ncbi:glutamine amidotransferase [Tepidamorphus sp. 3E244]|uniref:glutamine amidotransferase n=1 Tax=Tepidamorphus sp. 3E244 TaxID=3385498 RepID=UPI0038FCED80
MVVSVPCEGQTAGKVLIVVHQPTSTPGRIGLKLRERRYALDIRRPCLGHELPEDLSGYAGVVVFGGPQSANDCERYLEDEYALIGRTLEQEAPFLGVCLGAQMLVRQLGGKVEAHPHSRAEIGYYPIQPTGAGHALMDRWPSHVYQWHREGFEVPKGAELLARSDGDFENQAIRVGRTAYGIQFHPEVTRLMVHRWTTKGAARLALPGAQPKAEHVRGRFLHDPAIDAWLERFLNVWLSSRDQEAALAAE